MTYTVIITFHSTYERATIFIFHVSVVTPTKYLLQLYQLQICCILNGNMINTIYSVISYNDIVLFSKHVHLQYRYDTNIGGAMHDTHLFFLIFSPFWGVGVGVVVHMPCHKDGKSHYKENTVSRHSSLHDGEGVFILRNFLVYCGTLISTQSRKE